MRLQVNGTEYYFDTDGSELQVEGLQLSEKPIVIVLHGGLGFDHAYLKPGLAPLHDEAQFIYLDFRNQGRSEQGPLEKVTLEQLAADTAALCDMLKIKQAFFFGHSAGGFVALHLALQRPELVKGLILCHCSAAQGGADPDAPPVKFGAHVTPEVLAAAEPMFRGEINDVTLATFIQHGAPLYTAPGHDEAFTYIKLCRLSPDVMVHFMRNVLPHYDIRHRLGDISAPSLVLTGTYDCVCPPRSAIVLQKGLPHAELVEFTDSGHFSFFEQPDEFQRHMRQFIRLNA